jgi:hypothetical protein
MRRFVLGWKMLGLERSLGSRIVTYADDLVPEGQGRGGARLDARAHGQAEADGQRREDTKLQGARRVQLSGLHVRADVLAERLLRPTAGRVSLLTAHEKLLEQKGSMQSHGLHIVR